MTETVSATMQEILPLSGKQLVVRGMTGHEEDLLTDRKLLKKGQAIDKILQACVISIDGDKPTEMDISALTSADRTFILVQIRRMSYGDLMENAEIKCRERDCNEKSYFDIDLSELDITRSETGDDREFEIALPISGTKVKFRDMTGNDEKKVAKSGETEILTVGMMLRLVDVEGQHPNGYKKWLKSLPVKDRSFLRKAMEDTEVGLDTTIDAVCEECGSESKVRLEGLPAFFFPEM